MEVGSSKSSPAAAHCRLILEESPLIPSYLLLFRFASYKISSADDECRFEGLRNLQDSENYTMQARKAHSILKPILIMIGIG